jgi:hypothetical protein
LSLLHIEKDTGTERFSYSHKPYAQVTGGIQREVKQKQRALRLEPTAQ